MRVNKYSILSVIKMDAISTYLTRYSKDSYILSCCGYNDILKNLVKLKYSHLYAISTDKNIYNSPFYTYVKYLYGDPYNSHFPDSFFDIIYSIYKVDIPAFLREARRILSNNGVLVMKSDEVDTGQLKGYGFSIEDKFHGGFLSLRLTKKEGRIPKRINIVVPTLGKFEGIAHTTNNMKRNLEKHGIAVNLYEKAEDAPKNYPTIFEWHPALGHPIPKDKNIIIELHHFELGDQLFSMFKKIIRHRSYFAYYALLNYKNIIAGLRTNFINYMNKKGLKGGKIMREELQRHPLLVRSNELAEVAGLTKYYLMPHCIVDGPKVKPAPLHSELCIGSYGFAAPYKNFEAICEVALRLNVKALLLLSVNHLDKRAKEDTNNYANYIYKKYNGKGKITVKIGNFSEEELRSQLAPCTHLLAPQFNENNVSSSMRFMVSLNKPVIAIDSYQAREAQVIRVKSLKQITKEFLNRTRSMLTNIDDGTRYAIKVLQSLNKG